MQRCRKNKYNWGKANSIYPFTSVLTMFSIKMLYCTGKWKGGGILTVFLLIFEIWVHVGCISELHLKNLLQKVIFSLLVLHCHRCNGIQSHHTSPFGWVALRSCSEVKVQPFIPQGESSLPRKIIKVTNLHFFFKTFTKADFDRGEGTQMTSLNSFIPFI